MLDRKKLPDLDPLTREEIAQWIEYQGQLLTKTLGRTEALSEQHPEYGHLSRQAVYYRHAIAFANMLAYQVRVAKTRKLTAPPVQAR